MASPIPAKLKAADISRFALRAAQLEKAKPVIAYYCNYLIVNQILAKGLHNADSECVNYTTTLMDKLERFKAENQDNDAVTDDLVGREYVEQFGLETFERAEKAVQANKASRQTADTFQAGATFLELLQIWGEVDPEITAKIKFAKYHALRIAKALKAGEDPNLSNPTPKPGLTEAEVLPPLDPNDADVQELSGGVGLGATKPRQPSVVEIPDETDNVQRRLAQKSLLDESLHPSRASSVPPSAVPRPKVEEVPDESHRMQRNLARQSSLDESLHPSRAPSIPRHTNGEVSPPAPNDPSSYYTGSSQQPDVSPMEPSSSGDRKESIGGNYFPAIPGNHDQAPMDLPPPPQDFASHRGFQDTLSQASLPDPPSSFSPSSDRGDFQNQHHSGPPPLAQHHGHCLPPTAGIPPSLLPQSNPRRQIPQAPPQLRQPQDPLPPPQHTSGPAYYQPPPPPQQQQQLPPQIPVANVLVDEEAMMKAQKHARWAISALNFEDVPTAIKELRGALQTLGAK